MKGVGCCQQRHCFKQIGFPLGIFTLKEKQTWVREQVESSIVAKVFQYEVRKVHVCVLRNGHHPLYVIVGAEGVETWAETLVSPGGVLRPWSDSSTRGDHKGPRPHLPRSRPYSYVTGVNG